MPKNNNYPKGLVPPEGYLMYGVGPLDAPSEAITNQVISYEYHQWTKSAYGIFDGIIYAIKAGTRLAKDNGLE